MKRVARLYPSADHGLEFHFGYEYQLSFGLTKSGRYEGTLNGKENCALSNVRRIGFVQ